jgi:8-oxo-dGTP pyrophosphatase MutT (NUDIX family)
MYSSIDFVPMVKDALPSKYHTTEWGFAKGRKNLNESGLECAIREFKEETGLFDDDFRIIPRFNPVAENFIGSDGVRYSHIYYLAEVKNNIDMRYRSKNACLLQEVKNIGFFEYKECYNLFRDYDVQKKFTLTKIREYIIKCANYQNLF